MTSTDKRAARAGFEEMALASLKGTFARSRGRLGDANPYLVRSWTGQESEATRLAKCDAWWQGWDAEDKRRRAWMISTTQELAPH